MAEKYTEAQKKATYKYMQSQDRIEIKLPKGSRERIKNHAEKTGESVTGFISSVRVQRVQPQRAQLIQPQSGS